MYEKTAQVQYNSIPLVTSLPASADNGDEIVLTDSMTAGTYHWHLRYVAARSSNKWVFVGGPPMRAEVQTGESTTSTSYTDLATVGPTLTVPVAGSYLIEFGALSYNTGTGICIMSYIATGGAGSDAKSVRGGGVASAQSSGWKTAVESSLAAGNTVKGTYRVTANTGTWEQRHLIITPVALGG